MINVIPLFEIMTEKEASLLKLVAHKASILVEALMMAYGNHYPGGMVELWELDKALGKLDRFVEEGE